MTDIYSIQLYEHFPTFSNTNCIIFIQAINPRTVYNFTNFNGKIVSTTPSINPTHLKVNWEKKIDGLIFMLDFLVELFPNSKICCLHFGEESEKDRKTVVQWIEKKQLSVELCRIEDEISSDDVSYILENVNITSGLEINTELPDDFNCTLPRKLEHFECENSKWITKDQLLNMNYEYFYIIRTRFRNEDVSAFIIKWLDGALPELRFCILHVSFFNLDKTLNGVKYQKTVSSLQCTVKPSKYSEDQHEMNGVYDYESDDGKVLTIGMSSHYLLGNLIQLHVWSKF